MTPTASSRVPGAILSPQFGPNGSSLLVATLRALFDAASGYPRAQSVASSAGGSSLTLAPSHRSARSERRATTSTAFETAVDLFATVSQVTQAVPYLSLLSGVLAEVIKIKGGS
ncbi:hypothetical protein MSAN_01121600 [Mycena sanguinolenta]|uniref:Uncharacterized protein n=1 Tax=Mycena sanguinolenta TaxID=230812 RepID=A0A8H6YKU9_9AGAR|nr:hypothetical protein MSAN_01121600 [Mycena sanguinolenta]